MKKYKIEFNGQYYEICYLKTPVDFAKAYQSITKSSSKTFGLDLETGRKAGYLEDKAAGLCPFRSFIRLCQLYVPDSKTAYVYDLSGQTEIESLRRILREKIFIAHYAIFEIKHIRQQFGIDIDTHCSMLMTQFVENAEHSIMETYEEDDETGELKKRRKITGGFGLGNLIERYFNVYIPKELQVSDWNKPELDDEQILYAGLDAILTYEIGKILIPKIKEYKMQKAYNLYRKMQNVIAEMELNGIYVDKKAHSKLITDWNKEVVEANAECKKIFGSKNLRSPKQLHEWVVKNVPEDIKKRWPVSEKTGFYTFNKLKLGGLVNYAPIKTLLHYKKYATLLSTFGKNLQEKINPVTNRLHCHFALGETRTGRLSSRNPNLQNMPARDKTFRSIFCAKRNRVLVVADFSQIEVRVAAELSKDPVMRKAFKDGIDLHKAIVATIEKKSIDKVTDEERQLGKAVNFGLAFGMGAKKLSLYAKTSYGVDMSDDEAQKAWEAYHNLYSRYSAWCKAQRDKAAELGYVRTVTGKMRKLEEGEMYTCAVNTPVQGSAAEVMFYSMIKMYQKCKEYPQYGIKVVNTIHDEVLLECPKEYKEQTAELLVKSMKWGMKQLFPDATGIKNLTEAGHGKNWAEAKG